MNDNPSIRALALNSLGANPGWAVYCARFDDLVAKRINAVIFDTKTTDEERRTLVAARALLTDSYAPEKMRMAMIVVAEGEINRAENRKR